MVSESVPTTSREAAAEAERVVAWLRLPAVGLLALAEGLAESQPEETAFVAALALFSVWSVAVVAWVHLRPVSERLALAATGVDIVAVSVLALLSGGAFSEARLAFFLVPIAVAFRFRASVTAAAACVATSAYVIQAVLHSSTSRPHAARFIATQAGFLVWVGLACALLALLLARRTDMVARLAADRSQLLADALEAEGRERRALAEALHDEALQNLLSARHDIEEVADATTHPALDRADAALTKTVGELRAAVFELHPYVLEQAGLVAAIRALAQQAGGRAGLTLELDLRDGGRHPHEMLLFSAARELITNVVRHAGAHRLTVRLVDDDSAIVLSVEDDGRGFPAGLLAQQLARGHVGLASQRVRVEAAGGSLEVSSAPDRGTRVTVRLPLA